MMLDEPELATECIRAPRAHDLRRKRTTVELDDGGNAHHAVALRDRGVLINVHLDELRLVADFGGQFLKLGTDHPARTTPWSPKIHDDGDGGVEYLGLEFVSSDVLDSFAHDRLSLILGTTRYKYTPWGMYVNRVQQPARSVTIAESDAHGREPRVESWIWLIAASIGVGAAFVTLMVCPRASQLLTLLVLALAITVSVSFIIRIGANLESLSAVGAAVLFSLAGASAGYWAAAAMLPLLARPDDRSPVVVKPSPPNAGGRTAVVLLSCAEPARYRVRATARELQRLLTTGALDMPSAAIPFVFLSEKARYRQIRDRHPARDTVRGVAEQLEARLSEKGAPAVLVAWCDGRPSLADATSAAYAAGYASAVVAVAGADGAFEATTAIRAAEEAACSHEPQVRLRTAPSIWRVETLAARLCERVLESTRGIERGAVGVALIAEGTPAQWELDHATGAEHETYFLQRVRLLLTERGISANAVRIGWLEWQSPDVTETVRHLAATGCERIIVVPATAATSTLGIMVDLPHLIESARLPDNVHAVTLSAWNDDPGLVDALVESVASALARV